MHVLFFCFCVCYCILYLCYHFNGEIKFIYKLQILVVLGQALVFIFPFTQKTSPCYGDLAVLLYRGGVGDNRRFSSNISLYLRNGAR